MHRTKAALLAAGLLLAAPVLAQADIYLKVGSDTYEAAGQGECKHAARASIHGIPAALTSVSHRAGRQSLNLTLWQPQDGKPAMLSLSLTAGGKTYVVDTVKDRKGSGKAALQQSARGGSITLDAVAASGEKIAGKIQCRSLGGVNAEGG